MAWTRSDGQMWTFCLVDHYSVQGPGPIHVAKVSDRFAACSRSMTPSSAPEAG